MIPHEPFKQLSPTKKRWKKNDNVGYLSYVNDLCQDSGNPIVLPLCWCCWSLPFTVCCRNGAPTNACEILHQEGVVGHGKVSSHMVKQVDVIEFGWQPPAAIQCLFSFCSLLPVPVHSILEPCRSMKWQAFRLATAEGERKTKFEAVAWSATVGRGARFLPQRRNAEASLCWAEVPSCPSSSSSSSSSAEDSASWGKSALSMPWHHFPTLQMQKKIPKRQV